MNGSDFEEFQVPLDERVLARIWWIYDPPPPFLLEQLEFVDYVRLYTQALEARVRVLQVQQELIKQQAEVLQKYMG